MKGALTVEKLLCLVNMRDRRWDKVHKSFHGPPTVHEELVDVSLLTNRTTGLNFHVFLRHCVGTPLLVLPFRQYSGIRDLILLPLLSDVKVPCVWVPEFIKDVPLRSKRNKGLKLSIIHFKEVSSLPEFT